MKNILLLAAIVTTILSCKNNMVNMAKEHVDYTIISGKVTNFPYDTLYFLKDGSKHNRIALKIGKDGSFRDTLDLKEGSYSFPTTQTYFYLRNGMDLSITFDAINPMVALNSIVINGEGSQINNFYIKTNRVRKNNQYEAIDLDAYSFKEKRAQMYASFLEAVDTITNVPQSFIEREKRFLHYGYLNELLSFKKRLSKEKEIPDDYLSELKDLELGNESDFSYGKYNIYRMLLNSYYDMKALKYAEKDSKDYYLAYFKQVATNPNETIRNKLAYFQAEIFARYKSKDSKHLPEIFEAFNAVSSDKQDIKKIESICLAMNSVNPGDPSPIFVNYENHAGGTTSLSDFKGKYVYIDLWATWCGPCKREIPFLNELEKTYHGKNIDFVSISLDGPKDYEKWKQMVIDRDMKGVQLLADKLFKSDFVKGYTVNFIPRFLLIDPQGNIVTASAPKPSDKEDITKLFDTLNI